MKPFVVFDLETAPDLAAVELVTPPFDPDSVKCGNIKQPALVAEKIAAAADAYWSSAREKAALKPETSRIVAIGLAYPHEEPLLWTGDEAELLRRFWNEFTGTDLLFAFFSGNNGRGKFDVRHLLFRSWANGIVPPEEALDLGTRGRWVDIAERYLIGADTMSFVSANAAAKALNLIGTDLGWAVVRDKDELPVTGKDFHLALENQRIAALDYLRNDLAMETAIARVVVGKAVPA